MSQDEFFLEALAQAKTLLKQDGEDLRKQALAFLLAADIQHRSNAQLWLMRLAEDELSSEQRYEAGLQMAVAHQDQGQIAWMIEKLADMDFEVDTDEVCLKMTAELIESQLKEEFEVAQPLTGDQSLIQRLNRLIDD